SRLGHPAEGKIWLEQNGKRVQDGDLNQMIWKVPEIIAELSKLFTLAPGDIIMTGTPACVGAVARGDRINCGIDDLDR
ncbi:fumarylacetoacetate hydrolase family protein, partial [Rhizobium ruizarguesonis]